MGNIGRCRFAVGATCKRIDRINFYSALGCHPGSLDFGVCLVSTDGYGYLVASGLGQMDVGTVGLFTCGSILSGFIGSALDRSALGFSINGLWLMEMGRRHGSYCGKMPRNIISCGFDRVAKLESTFRLFALAFPGIGYLPSPFLFGRSTPGGNFVCDCSAVCNSSNAFSRSISFKLKPSTA